MKGVTIGLLAVLSIACGTGSSGKCRLGNLMVTPADDSVLIADVTADGSACTNATCGVRGGVDAACLAYGVKLVSPGTCTVHVQLANGAIYTDTVNVSAASASSDCSGELQPDRDIVVPSQNGGG